MATSPNKPSATSLEELPISGTLPEQRSARSEQMLPHSEALQALLAFSALHQQIRDRRSGGIAGMKDDAFETELFVLDEVLQLVAERAQAITGADGIAIALAEGEAIVCRASAGTVCPDVGVRLDPRSDFSGACLRAGLVVRCDDAESDLRVNREACRKLGTLSMVAVPLCGATHVIGLVQAFSRDAMAFNDSDVRSLNLLAELLLAALRPEDEERITHAAEVATSGVSGSETAPKNLSMNWKPAPKPAPKAFEVREGLAPLFAEPIVFDPLDSGERGTPGFMVVAAMVLVAGMLAGGLWWKLRHRTQMAANVTSATEVVAPGSKTASLAQNSVTPVAPIGAQMGVPVSDAQDLAGSDFATQQVSEDTRRLAVLPKVTGLRHWSSPDASTVVIDLQDQVPYEAHRLTSPERIYFDLHDTVLAQSLVGKSMNVGDPLLSRVRVAQPVQGVTRIVLDTTAGSDFAVSLEQNPYRLVVSLRGSPAGTAVAKAKPELFPRDPRPEKSRAALTVPPLSAEDKQLGSKVAKIRVVVDAGHGGSDLGTVGRKGLLEKDLVLEIAQRLGRMLESRLGSEVVYTRRNDTYLPLDQRAEVANEARADLFVSIHANYSDYPSARGVETYYTNVFVAPGSKEAEGSGNATLKRISAVAMTPEEVQEKRSLSRKLAASVQKAMFGMLAKNPTIRNRGVKEASFVVLKGTTMPSILAEVSFVSSPTDEANLRSAEYRQQIAEALYKGIARYAASSHRASMASAVPGK